MNTIPKGTAAALALLAPALAGCVPAAPPATPAPAAAPAAIAVAAITDAAALVHAAHARYARTWYRSLFFRQTVVRPGRPAEVWAEYAEIPGRLRLEFADGASGSGVIYAADSVYVFQRDSLVRRAADVNPLMLLGFDLYVQPPQRTLEQLRAQGFDLDRFHRTEWQGRPAYVVGAHEGDLRSPQFWVDAERLLFVRLLRPTGADGASTSDIRFDAYAPLAGGWIAPEVVFLVDGEEVMREDYFDVQANLPVDPRLFDPAHWRATRGAGPRGTAAAP